MRLNNIFLVKFIERKNRFVWEGLLNWEKVLFHIWDTGRLQELLFKNNDILVQKMPDDGRKYQYRLVAAKWLQWEFILLNSLLHSALVREYLKENKLNYKAEVQVWESKIDFYIENIWFVEIKGCSLIKNINWEFIWMFPDAPTIRWQKHLKELLELKKQWKQAELWFLLTNNVNKFQANTETDPKFSELFYKFVSMWW